MTSASSYNASPYWYENNLIPADPSKSPYEAYSNLFVMEKELWEAALRSAETGMDANCYLIQSRALTLQNIGWKRGDYSRGWRANEADGLGLVKAEVLMMPSKTDGSVRPNFAEEVVDILRTMGKKAKLHVIDSEKGHNGFTEYYQMIPVMNEFIKSLPSAKK